MSGLARVLAVSVLGVCLGHAVWRAAGAALPLSANQDRSIQRRQELADPDTSIHRRQEKGCGMLPADIAFLLDTSASIHEKNFDKAHGDRDGIANILIVVTDGDSSNPNETAIEAAKLHKANVSVLAVGVGSHVHPLELQRIASGPENVFNVAGFAAREFVLDRLKKTACETTCGTAPADIEFALDTTISVGDANFEKVKDFLKVFADMFEIGPTKTNVGVVSFDDKLHNEFWLNNYTSKSSLVEAINGIQYHNGSRTNTFLALNHVLEEAFTEAHGDRDKITNILIVITDGQSSNRSSTEYFAKKLHETNLTILAIGVGDYVGVSELEIIANGKENVFNVEDFAALDTLKDQLKLRTCEAIDVMPPPQNTTGTPVNPTDNSTMNVTGTPVTPTDNSTMNITGTPVTPTDNSTINITGTPVTPTDNSTMNITGTPVTPTDNSTINITGTPVTPTDNSTMNITGTPVTPTDNSTMNITGTPVTPTDNSTMNITGTPVTPSATSTINITGIPVSPTANNTMNTTGVCVFDNHIYNQNQMWRVGCNLECICDYAWIGHYSCHQIHCVQYGILPPKCRLVTVEGECCATLDCNPDNIWVALTGTQ